MPWAFPNRPDFVESAKRESQDGETFFEFRLDYLPDADQGIEAIRCLLKDRPELMVLATCRHNANHGRFTGTIEEQIRILKAAIAAGAQAVDLEIESAEKAKEELQDLHARSHFVLSYHNFESTPNMDAVVRRMLRIDAWAYKIVSTARKPSDMLRVLNCCKGHPKTRFILMAMGETGFPTRVIAPIYGSLYSYAAPASAEGTAPGQVCARQLRNLYRIEKLGRATKVYGVIADPVGHSKSPVIHNRAMQARRVDAVYLPFLVSPAHLSDFMGVAEKLRVCGFSVTIPHKQKIVRHLDVVDPLARRIGAVNTVWRKAGKWRGANTDVPGVIGPLSKRLRLAKSSVPIAGYGGAARAAAFALSDAGAEVVITGRDLDKAKALARATGAEVLPPELTTSRQFDVFVHATPLGMHPHTDGCFFPDAIPADVVFDMVYNPLETTLLQRAREQGSETIAGIEMFVEQAAHQFEIWTGESAPRPVMERAVLDALGQ